MNTMPKATSTLDHISTERYVSDAIVITMPNFTFTNESVLSNLYYGVFTPV